MVRMDITPFVHRFREDVVGTSAALGPEAADLADRLTPLLDNALRLVLLDALSNAAAEITTELPGHSVEVRLRGRDPEFVVVGSGVEREPVALVGEQPDADAAEPSSDADGPTARVTVRLPEALKNRAEALASERGQSLNTWIVGAMRLATLPGVADATGFFAPGAPGRNRTSTKRVQGWVR